MKYNLFLMDIAVAGNMNGVTRCIQMLVNALSMDRDYNVTWVRFICHRSDIVRRKIDSASLIEIPFPKDLGSFLGSPALKQSFWNESYEIIRDEIKRPGKIILHIHTLNLIDFALFVRQRRECKIVTHLHCIPWKSLYNRNKSLFMDLYEKYYIKKDYTSHSIFVSKGHEHISYTKSDCLVCVTRCARDFVKRMCPEHTKIEVIYNGIEDLVKNEGDIYRSPRQVVNCLFVGNAHPSKGLEFVLKALNIVQRWHEVILFISGAYTNRARNEIVNAYPFLDVRFTGQLPLMKLQEYYRFCDIGIIASLQEQCSYVAIEMMMFGLPIIATDVDGLHELFAKNGCCCHIPIQFIPGQTIRPDVEKMVHSISTLIKHPALRERIARQARHRFKRKYEKGRMVSAIKALYYNI